MTPLNSQSLNRYAYVWNNPLSFTDPSGYFLSSIFKALKKVFKAITRIIKAVVKVIKKVIKVIIKSIAAGLQYLAKKAPILAAIAIGIVAPYAAAAILGVGVGALGFTGAVLAGAIGGGISGFIATGSLSGLLKGAAFGAIGGAIGFGIAKTGIASAVSKGINSVVKLGTTGFSTLTNYINSGLSGGVISKLQGGSFSKGFVNAFKSAVIFSVAISVGRWTVNNAGEYINKAADFIKGAFNRVFNSKSEKAVSFILEDLDSNGNVIGSETSSSGSKKPVNKIDSTASNDDSKSPWKVHDRIKQSLTDAEVEVAGPVESYLGGIKGFEIETLEAISSVSPQAWVAKIFRFGLELFSVYDTQRNVHAEYGQDISELQTFYFQRFSPEQRQSNKTLCARCHQ